MRYEGHFLVDINGTRVAKNATVNLNNSYGVGRKETYLMTISTEITKAEFQALVQAHMNRRAQIETNNST